MKRVVPIILAVALIISFAVQATAEQGSLWGQTLARLSQERVWRNQVRVTIMPLNARVILARLSETTSDVEKLGQLWTEELKRLGNDKNNAFLLTVTRLNPDKPSTALLGDLLKSPFLIVGAERLFGRAIQPFAQMTLEQVQTDSAIIAFERRESLISEWISPKVRMVTLRLVNPDNLYDVTEWVEADIRLPLPYPAELEDLYKRVSVGVPRTLLSAY